ncbi:MAG: hypothetical protein LBR91_03610 [Puniceicoccales bacterium]|jgi:hypothetical protein|nr:hypothetical protein [Puniceicoccales bacterium]
MKGRTVFMVILNVVLWSFVLSKVTTAVRNRSRHGGYDGLESVEKILFHNQVSGYKFSLQKSQRNSGWEVAWSEGVWPANIFAIEDFHGKLKNYFGEVGPGKDLSLCTYEVTLVSKGSRKTVKLTAENVNITFFGENFPGARNAIPDDDVVACFLNTKIFPCVRDDCKIFRVKSKSGEFVFAKRHGKWFLDGSVSNFEIRGDLVAKFFHEIFAAEGKKICRIRYSGAQPCLSVTLYGDMASERVNFYVVDGTYFIENAVADLFFEIGRECFSGVESAAAALMHLQIFPIAQCDDINVVQAASGDYFNFHHLKSRGKWQFTYSRDGTTKVREIPHDQVGGILDLLGRVEPIGIVQELATDDMAFTLTLGGKSTGAKIFTFYVDGERLFVGSDGESTKFELKRSFYPAFFQMIRSISADSDGNSS